MAISIARAPSEIRSAFDGFGVHTAGTLSSQIGSRLDADDSPSPSRGVMAPQILGDLAPLRKNNPVTYSTPTGSSTQALPPSDKMNVNAPSNTFISIPGLGNRKNAGRKHELRIPFLGFLPNKPRNHFVAMVGEFIGTFLFLFFAFSATQVANASAAGAETGGTSLTTVPNAGVLLYISLAFGFSLAVNAWVFFRISGGLFNPAVVLGMALIGAVSWVRAGLVFIAEILGSICAAAVVSALFPGPLNVSTTLSSGTSVSRGLFIEMFLTAELVFTIFMLAAEKHKGTFLAPIGIGLALFIAELSGVYFTGGSLNPARSFGPCVVTRVFPSLHWVYWLGPALGALLAVGFYRFVKMLEYETANPGQDFNEHEAEQFHFDEENATTGADVARPAPGGNPDTITNMASRQSGQMPRYGAGNIPSTGDMNRATATSAGPGRLDGSLINEKLELQHGSFDNSSRLESGGMHPGFGKSGPDRDPGNSKTSHE